MISFICFLMLGGLFCLPWAAPACGSFLYIWCFKSINYVYIWELYMVFLYGIWCFAIYMVFTVTNNFLSIYRCFYIPHFSGDFPSQTSLPKPHPTIARSRRKLHRCSPDRSARRCPGWNQRRRNFSAMD